MIVNRFRPFIFVFFRLNVLDMGADLVSRNLHKSLSINELWRRGGRKVISPSFLKTYNNNQTKENPHQIASLAGEPDYQMWRHGRCILRNFHPYPLFCSAMFLAVSSASPRLFIAPCAEPRTRFILFLVVGQRGHHDPASLFTINRNFVGCYRTRWNALDQDGQMPNSFCCGCRR